MRFKRFYAAACSVLLAVSLCSCGELGDEKGIEKLSAPATGITTTTRKSTTAQTEAVTVTGDITTVITDKKCRSISFDGGYVLFIDKNDKYTIMNKDQKAVKSLTLTDDNGGKIMLSTDKSGSITCKSQQGDELNEFLYKGNKISIKDGEVYFAGTKLEYYDASFSKFEITEGVVVECIGKNKFIIRKDGKAAKEPVLIKDDNGAPYTLEAVDEGIEITNSDNELMISLVIGGKYLDVANGHVIVNGQTMEPQGAADIKTYTTTTTTKKKEKETEKESETETKTETVVVTQAPVVYYEETWDDGEIYEEPSQPVVTESPMASNKNVNISSDTAELLGYVNEVRRQYGLNELYGLELLDKASYIRAEETADQYFSKGNIVHQRPDGSGCETVVDDVGLPDWTAYCENLCYGMNSQSKVKEAFDAWMNSEGHRKNILNADVKYMGVACYKTTRNGDDYYFWAQFFYNDTF